MQISIENPYDEYFQKLIDTEHFQNAEQVVQYDLNEKFQLNSWNKNTLSLIKESLNDIKEGRAIELLMSIKLV